MTSSDLQTPQEEAAYINDPEPNVDGDNWDDELDGEGDLDPDATWEGNDALSIESSVTISSTKTSSKRTFDDLDEELDTAITPSSPPGTLLFDCGCSSRLFCPSGSKRFRVEP